MGIGPRNKKNRVGLLPQIPGVKMKIGVAESVSGRGVDLSTTGKRAYEHLHITMESVCMVYDFPFRRLLENVEQFGKDSLGRVCMLGPATYPTILVGLQSSYIQTSISYVFRIWGTLWSGIPPWRI